MEGLLWIIRPQSLQQMNGKLSAEGGEGAQEGRINKGLGKTEERRKGEGVKEGEMEVKRGAVRVGVKQGRRGGR